ncbi:MAG: 4-(cytidine 5'-diphospho)-2-C-methyl-D-erythritol kinase [Cyanobacteriota bacterium]|nr:4-(cytidine 5'-diphospho)-2-C-methyl-D-erythritol kinase [Cyanobacteriota bacterium]
MQSCFLEARAKINIYLEILGQRPDGFHEVAMVLQSIALADHLHLRALSKGIYLRSDHPQVPQDATNLAYRAAALLQEECAGGRGVEIILHKRIPVGAGLAGGSTDAAAVLVGLNQLWELGLTVADLQILGSRLGSDVPFCITGGTQLATGRGEILEPLADLPLLPLILAKPKELSIPTVWAYQTYRQLDYGHVDQSRPASRLQNLLLTIGQTTTVSDLVEHLANDLERAVLPHHPVVGYLKEVLLQAGALGVLMSGSGSAVFGLMLTDSDALAMQERLSRTHPEFEFWATHTTPTAIVLTQD